MHWKAYIIRRGSLNIGRRIEQSLAQIKLMQGIELGIKDRDEFDYMPHEEPPVITFEEMRRQYDDET